MFTRMINKRRHRIISVFGLLILTFQLQAMALNSCRMDLAELASQEAHQTAQDHTCCASEQTPGESHKNDCEDCRSCPVCISNVPSTNQSTSIARTIEQIVEYRVPGDMVFNTVLSYTASDLKLPDSDLSVFFQLPPISLVLRI